MLVALVTVSVAISSPGYDKKFVIVQYPCLITTEPPTAEVYVFGDKMTKYGKKKQQWLYWQESHLKSFNQYTLDSSFHCFGFIL